MRRMFILAALVSLFWVSPQTVSADPIVILFNRNTSARVEVGTTVAQDFDSNADVLASTASTAVGGNAATAESTLTSILTPDNSNLSGSGSTINAVTGSASSSSNNQALLRFFISEPYTYSFLGSFAALATGTRSGFWETSLHQRSPDFTSSQTIFAYRDLDALTRNESGTLLPGFYEFFVGSRTFVRCPGFAPGDNCTSNAALTSFSFDFQLTPEAEAPAVPEPASMILLSTGLAGVFAARRRHRRQL